MRLFVADLELPKALPRGVHYGVINLRPLALNPFRHNARPKRGNPIGALTAYLVVYRGPTANHSLQTPPLFALPHATRPRCGRPPAVTGAFCSFLLPFACVPT